jgi:uncharacterized protein DUF4159
LRTRLRYPLTLALAVLLAASSMLVAGSSAPAPGASAPPLKREFDFVRLAYADSNGFGSGFGRRGSWTTDAPEAEEHFLQGLKRLSRVDAGDEGTYVQPLDPQLFEHPWIYGVEVGRWYLSDAEAAQIREYLLRGGFLMVDDFHGTLQWEAFMESMRRVFPDRPVVEIPDDHEVFHVAYDLGGPVTPYNLAVRGGPDGGTGGHRKIQIPGIWAVMNGTTYEQDGVTPHWRGIFDDQGRLMVAINFNMDMGDAWEHADNPQYPQMLTALAYRFGVNYVLYAMTH